MDRSERWLGIEAFVAVAECGGFSAAAERLGVSSSHVSRQVAALEERLQTRLFYRSTRQVALTEIGNTFLQHCRQLQDGHDEALRVVQDMGGVPKGLLFTDADKVKALLELIKSLDEAREKAAGATAKAVSP